MVDLSADSDESIIPAEWHYVLVLGALCKAWSEQGVDGFEREYYGRFQLAREHMVARCRPVRGEVKRVAAAPIFRLSLGRNRRKTNVTY